VDSSKLTCAFSGSSAPPAAGPVWMIPLPSECRLGAVQLQPTHGAVRVAERKIINSHQRLL